MLEMFKTFFQLVFMPLYLNPDVLVNHLVSVKIGNTLYIILMTSFYLSHRGKVYRKLFLTIKTEQFI